MMETMLTRRQLMLALSAAPLALAAPAIPDSRDIANGSMIPREGYSDQPYVVVNADGSWTCVLTTGKGVEGQSGQHIVAAISMDQGRTWSPPVDIEPADGPEASWVMPFLTPGGRIYAFYTYNADNLRFDEKSNNPGIGKRVDTLGRYAFKYSDDGGRSWSTQRWYIPVRKMRIDRENAWGGNLAYFWGVGKPVATRHGMMLGFAKVGKWGDPGAMVTSQGCFLRSDNILTERDPARIRWKTLPEGDEGLRAPKGPVSDEANLVELSDGSLYCTYRTIDGYNCHAYSRDGGRTWTPPAYATYTPGGRRIKHPRAANFVRKFSNGKYLLWFHNHGGEPVHGQRWSYYMGRNPAWICGGIEKSGFIHWSQPEILLYDADPAVRISYPDFIEDRGQFFVTETMKTWARVHRIERTLLEGVWKQLEEKRVTSDGLVLAVSGKEADAGRPVNVPSLPDLVTGGGFTIEFWIRLSELSEGQTVLDTRLASGKGFAIRTSDRFTLAFTMNDGARDFTWDTDPGTHEGTLKAGAWHHVAFVIDGGPKIVTTVVDGTLNDGGAVRQYGWGRFDKVFSDVNGVQETTIAPKLFGEVRLLRIYNRHLRTSEVVSNFRAGLTA